MQNNRRLQSIPDQLLLSREFDRLADYAPQFQKLANLVARFVLPIARMWKFLQMDRSAQG